MLVVSSHLVLPRVEPRLEALPVVGRFSAQVEVVDGVWCVVGALGIVLGRHLSLL